MKRVFVFAIVLFCVVYGNSSFGATNDSAKDEIEKIKKTLAFDVDEVEGMTWINDKNTAKNEGRTNNIFHIYLGQKKLGQTYTWIRWRIGFRKSGWVFFDVVIFNVDGERIELDPGNTFREVLWGGRIVETVDVSGNDNLALLKKIAYSKKTIVRFKGSDYSHDFVVSNEQKAVLKKLLRYYELVK